MESSGKSDRVPNAAEVLDDIGEKAVTAFSKAVMRSKSDLATYRATFPQWVLDHSERGLANWISDRLWAHLIVLADEYVRGNVTTNHAEGFFSQLKRSLDGTFHHVSVEHLPRYLGEFDFRWSSRKLSDSRRVERLMGRTARRLTYNDLIGR